MFLSSSADKDHGTWLQFPEKTGKWTLSFSSVEIYDFSLAHVIVNLLSLGFGLLVWTIARHLKTTPLASGN